MGGGGGSLSRSSSSGSVVVDSVGTGGDSGGRRWSVSSPNGLASSKSDMVQVMLLCPDFGRNILLPGLSGLLFSQFAVVIGVSQ